MVQNPHDRYLYEKVRLLRSQGLSYREIREQFKTSKSTLSLWCRDIRLSNRQKERLLHKRSLAAEAGGHANHEKREKEIFKVKAAASKEIKKLTIDSFKIAGALLYWAEGAKTSSASISNSDPHLIEFMVWWFKKFFNITPTQLKAHMHLHYGNDEKRIKKYWSSLTGIPLQNFGKSFIKPKGTGHRTNILPNGIIRIRVSGNGTANLRHQIMTWSEKVYELSKQYR